HCLNSTPTYFCGFVRQVEFNALHDLALIESTQPFDIIDSLRRILDFKKSGHRYFLPPSICLSARSLTGSATPGTSPRSLPPAPGGPSALATTRSAASGAAHQRPEERTKYPLSFVGRVGVCDRSPRISAGPL